jgi:hypothetical protein
MHTVLLSIQKLDDGEYKILWLVEGVENFVHGYGYFAAPETRPFTSTNVTGRSSGRGFLYRWSY